MPRRGCWSSVLDSCLVRASISQCYLLLIVSSCCGCWAFIKRGVIRHASNQPTGLGQTMEIGK